MRKIFPALFLLLAAVVPLRAESTGLPESPNGLPTAPPPTRYASLALKSLFAPSAEAPPPVFQPKADFAADLFVSGLAQFGNKNFVMIINRRTHEKFSLLTGEKGPDGVELATVRWATDPAQSAVVVRCGAETSTLSFDEAAFQKPTVQPGAAGSGDMPRRARPFGLPRMPVMPAAPAIPPPPPDNAADQPASPAAPAADTPVSAPPSINVVRRLRIPTQ